MEKVQGAAGYEDRAGSPDLEALSVKATAESAHGKVYISPPKIDISKDRDKSNICIPSP